MSYILEALKKLEQKRRSEAEPFSLSVQYRGRQNGKRKFPWRHLIVFGLFLNLGIFLWLLHVWRSEKYLETGMKNVVQKTRVQRPQDISRDTTADRLESHSRQPEPIMKTKEGPSGEYEESVSTASYQAPRPASGDNNRNTKIIGMDELPLSVRQKLPDLSISGHFYDSRPSDRVVTVDGKVMHEGAAAAPGVTLERITPDGAIFSCDGLRFRKGVF